jgi:hypothetical protein
VTRDLSGRVGADAIFASTGAWGSSPIGPALRPGASGYAVIGTGSAPHLDFTGPFSVVGMARIDATGTDGAIFGKTGNSFNGYMLWKNPANSAITTYVNGSARIVGSTLSVGRWYTVGFTWDGTTLRQYLDGRPDGSAAYAVAPTTAGTKAYVGAYSSTTGGAPGWYLNGAISWVGVWGRALSAPEMLELALRPLATLSPERAPLGIEGVPAFVYAETAYATNFDPEDGAEAANPFAPIEWDFLTLDLGDPVRPGQLGFMLDGEDYPVTYSAITGGYHCTADPPRVPGRSYTATAYGDTAAAAGSPSFTSWSFTDRHIAVGYAPMLGVVPPDAPAYVAAAGLVPIASVAYVALSGLVRGDGVAQASYVGLSGLVAISVDLRLAALVVLQGWITEYVAEPGVVAAIQAGEAVSEWAAAAIEMSDLDGVSNGLDAVIVVEAVAVEPGLSAAVETVFGVVEPGVQAAVRAGEAVAERGVDGAIEAAGSEAEALLDVLSHSTEWYAEVETE